MEYLPTYLDVDPTTNLLHFRCKYLYQLNSGSSDDGGNITGLGNVIIGYDENDGTQVQSGSHNLIVGSIIPIPGTPVL